MVRLRAEAVSELGPPAPLDREDLKLRRTLLVGILPRILVGAAALLAVALSPPLRDSVVALEPGAAGVLYFAALAGAGTAACAHWLRRPRLQRRVRNAERQLSRLLARWGWVAAILLCLAPVWSALELRPPDETAAFSSLLGHVPWRDGRRHLEGGLRLLDAGSFGAFSERRPLTAAWLAVRLAVGGDPAAALGSQAVLLGLAVYLLGVVIGRRFGLWSALAICGVVHGLIRGLVPTFVTEPLGVTLACLALALLLSRAALARLPQLAAGVFVLGVALGARPGPQLLLPAVAAWGLWVHRARWRAAAVWLGGAAALAVLSPWILNGLYGSGEGSFSAYPAYTFYGLTQGGNFRQVRADFGDDTAASVEERRIAGTLYEKGFASLRAHPRRLLGALRTNLVKFATRLPSNLAPAVSLGPLFARHPIEDPDALPWQGFDRLARAAILLGALAFLAALWRASHAPERAFWLAAAVGLLASVPFVYGDAGFRGLAVAYPFLAGALALGFARRREVAPSAIAASERLALSAIWAFAGLVLLASLAGPPLARSVWRRPAPELLQSLTAGQDLVVDVETTPMVVVSSTRRDSLGHRPWLTREDYARLLAYAGFADDAHLESLAPPFAFCSTYDFVTRRQYVLIAPLSLARADHGFVRLRVEALGTGGKIYRATALQPLS
jgi:hypothetical protein